MQQNVFLKIKHCTTILNCTVQHTHRRANLGLPHLFNMNPIASQHQIFVFKIRKLASRHLQMNICFQCFIINEKMEMMNEVKTNKRF